MTSIAKMEKLSMVGVPFDGDGAQVPAILGGHVPVGTFAYSVGKSLIDAKKIKVLALLERQEGGNGARHPRARGAGL